MLKYFKLALCDDHCLEHFHIDFRPIKSIFVLPPPRLILQLLLHYIINPIIKLNNLAEIKMNFLKIML